MKHITLKDFTYSEGTAPSQTNATVHSGIIGNYVVCTHFNNMFNVLSFKIYVLPRKYFILYIVVCDCINSGRAVHGNAFESN